MEAVGTAEQEVAQPPAVMADDVEEVTYRVKEVAAMLNVSLATVYNLIASGDLPAYSIGPGRGTKRVPHSELMAYKDRCRARAVRAAH